MMMAGSKGKVRPLGAIRHSVGMVETVPRFPPLNSQEQKNDRLDKHYQGIHGNAIAGPPPRYSPEKPEPKTNMLRNTKSPQRSVMSSKSDTSSAKSDENAKELKDAMIREKQLKQQLMSLQKVIDELKAQIREKERVIVDLQQQFQRQEQYYKDLYEKEQERHSETKGNLENTKKDLDAKMVFIEELKTKHEQKLSEVNAQMEARLNEVREEKDKQIADQDEKIKRLKQHMADTLKGNSWERQQQIEELTKELQRVQDESETLRLKLKAATKGASANSPNTSRDSNSAQLIQARQQLREKDETISELKSICARFEKQLLQQDVLLKEWAEVKGQKGVKLSK